MSHWTDDAVCLNKPVEWFVAERGSRKDKRPPIERRALALCARCPVSDDCLSYALDNELFSFSVRADGEEPEMVTHHLEGVLAGTTLEDRRSTRHIKDRDERLRALKALADERARKLGLRKESA